jgi:hypothetical protein
LFSDIVKVLAARPWWEDLIVAMAFGKEAKKGTG